MTKPDIAQWSLFKQYDDDGSFALIKAFDTRSAASEACAKHFTDMAARTTAPYRLWVIPQNREGRPILTLTFDQLRDCD